jgi:hypothetical protein
MSETQVLAGFGAPIYVDRDLSFRESVNHQALGYWRSKCAGRTMPARAHLDPIEMRGFLPHVALVDVLGDPKPGYRIRLAGTAIEDVFGHLTGQVLADMQPYFAHRWEGIFSSAVQARAPIRITTRVGYDQKDFLSCEAMFAPVSEDGLHISMLFVSVGFWSDPPPAGR